MAINLNGISLSDLSLDTIPPPPIPMLLTFDTSLAGDWGPTNDIALPLFGTVNATVDWGDGNPTENFVAAGFAFHTYAVTGIYQVSITGAVTHFGSDQMSNFGPLNSLTTVDAWGTLGTTSFSHAFDSASCLLTIPPTLPPAITDISGMFFGTGVFNQDISGWDTSTFTDMSFIFCAARAFNQDISIWDTSAATTMRSMFNTAFVFNQNIGSWNTSAVIDMSEMFSRAYAFNQDISGWDTSNVTVMLRMFSDAVAFNQPIIRNVNKWNTGNVTSMTQMFNGATAFNQDLSGWCVTLIPSLPTNFYTNTPAWNKTSRIPVWGTCPP